jgi:hypothetical protein
MRYTLLVITLLLAGTTALAQPRNTARPTSEQSLEELVSEVRQLRTTLQRMNAAVYKGQITIERFKLQQDVVSRLSRELNSVRDSISETKPQTTRLRELVAKIEGDVEKGVRSTNDLLNFKTELDLIRQREDRLVLRESQLVNEVELERAKLNELNERLNLLEQELAPTKP